MPHVNIKHFPAPLRDEEQARLVQELTTAVTKAFKCDQGVVSIALEPIEKEQWKDRVYIPEITQRAALLRKRPSY